MIGSAGTNESSALLRLLFFLSHNKTLLRSNQHSRRSIKQTRLSLYRRLMLLFQPRLNSQLQTLGLKLNWIFLIIRGILFYFLMQKKNNFGKSKPYLSIVSSPVNGSPSIAGVLSGQMSLVWQLLQQWHQSHKISIPARAVDGKLIKKALITRQLGPHSHRHKINCSRRVDYSVPLGHFWSQRRFWNTKEKGDNAAFNWSRKLGISSTWIKIKINVIERGGMPNLWIWTVS